MKDPVSDQTKKRIAAIKQARISGKSQFSLTELRNIEIATLLSSKGGPGDEVPRNLDILCISAPVLKVKACLSPKWIEVMCYHSKYTWRVIRCRLCEGCQHAWRSKVRGIIMDGGTGHSLWFWTLTIRQYPYQIAGDRFDFAQKLWHKMMMRAGKRGVTFQYFRVVELQKRKTPHFHMAVKQVNVRGTRYTDTKAIRRLFRGLAKHAGFGYIDDLQKARLGSNGLASYMSKYLSKSEDYLKMRRSDGRAIRRYARSRGWCQPRPLPTWRFTSTGAISDTAQSERDTACDCSKGELLPRDIQAQRWVNASKVAGRWLGPLAVVDYLLEKQQGER